MKNIKVKQEWLNTDGTYKCPYCAKSYSKKGISTHIWRSHGDGESHDPNSGYKTNRTAWNKGKTAETSESIEQQSNTLKSKYESGELIPSWTNKKHSSETKQKMSRARSLNNKGGRSKWYNVKNAKDQNVKVQGTWELRFAKVLNLIDPDWIKPSLNHPEHSFEWIDDSGLLHTYTPDFWSPKLNKYFEIKGYWWGDDKRKMELVLEQHSKIKIEVVRKSELETYERLIK